MYPKLWAASGMPYRELVARLLDLAEERFAVERAKVLVPRELRDAGAEPPVGGVTGGRPDRSAYG